MAAACESVKWVHVSPVAPSWQIACNHYQPNRILEEENTVNRNSTNPISGDQREGLSVSQRDAPTARRNPLRDGDHAALRLTASVPPSCPRTVPREPPRGTRGNLLLKKIDVILMFIVLMDGAEIEGTIECYDKARSRSIEIGSISLCSSDTSYMYKADERDERKARERPTVCFYSRSWLKIFHPSFRRSAP